MAQRRYRLAVDGMGGDLGPAVVMEAVATAAKARDLHIQVTGDEAILIPELEKYPDVQEFIEIRHAEQAIPMDASPKIIFEKYPRSSMIMAAEEVAQGHADALISAGNTGALVLASAQSIPRLPSVHRTALAAVYPSSASPSANSTITSPASV